MLTLTFPAGDATVYDAPAGIAPLTISTTNLEVDYQAFRDGTEPFTDYSGNSRSASFVTTGPAFQPNPAWIPGSGAFTMVFAGRVTTENTAFYAVGSLLASVGISLRLSANGSGVSSVQAFYNDGANISHDFGDPGIDGDAYAHFALTWDGVNTTAGEVKAYVNGAQFGATHTLRGPVATLPDGSTSTHRLRLLTGATAATEWQWASYYSRQMSAADVLADYQARQNRLRVAGISM